MLTAIRGDQIKNNQIHNGHIVEPSHPKFSGGIAHEKLNLTNSIVASFLHTDESVHRAVLDSHLVALWDVATSQSVTGTSIDVTTVVNSTATSAAYQGVDAEGQPESGNPKAVLGTTEKGVLTTGTGSNGAGTQNYRIQIRDASSKDPVHDQVGGRVYGQLTNNSIGSTTGDYTLEFFDSENNAFAMAVAEISTIKTVADVEVEQPATGTDSATYKHSLNGKYFEISSPTTDYYVWYNVSGESATDPAISGKTAIAVTISPEASATDVATATASAIGGEADFSASSSTDTVTVTNANAGVPLSPLSDGFGGKETGFTLTVPTVGTPTVIDFMFMEVFSYLTAPALSFANGIGFADIVGVAGSHNHHDLYYTKIELEGGQLNNLYYLKNQLDSGQLDNRYYTEGELDPNPGSDSGEAKLDTRYFRESEITSSAGGSSGARLVGVASNGQLTSSNVQDALVELQGDIDDILDGTANINHSLDRAYDDGSVIAVDDTNVDWQLTDSKSFKVSSDTGATDVLRVDAGAAGDEVEVNGTFDVNGASAFTGTVAQDGGAVTLNTGSTVDIDGTNVTIDGTAASSFATTDANLTVETKTSGDLIARSAGAFNLKDVNLSTALPLSQSGVTGLSTNFDTATSIVGALNENVNDLYTLINTTLPATTDGAAGADQVGATGITGVIPTGGSLGGDGTVQEMLEGIARGAGGGKVFPTLSGAAATGSPSSPGGFTEEKAGGMYFKQNEIVYIKDVDRFVMVTAQGTGVDEGTDWDYLWGANRPLAGNSFNVTSDNVVVDTTGSLDVDVEGGVDIADDSGARFAITAAGVVDVDSAPGEIVTVSSDTEIELNGGALVDIDGDAITMDGQLTATGASDDNMIIQTTGTGEVQLSSADEIDLTGGDIDINAGTGHVVTVDSDTSIAATAPVVDINGATSVDIDGAAINTTGVLTQTGNAQIVGDLDMDGSVDMDGATATFDTTGAFSVTAATDVDIAGDTVDLDASGAHVGLTTDGQVDVDAATGQLVDITSDTEVQIDGGALVDIDGTTVTIDGATTVTGAANDNFTVNTTGSGDIFLNTESALDVDAPSSFFRGDVSIDSGYQLSTDKINITSVDPSDFATITGQRTGIPFTGNLLANPGFEAGSGNDADNWTEGTFSGRTQAEKYYDNWSFKYDNDEEPGGVSPAITQAVTGLNIATHIVSFWFKGTAQSAIEVVVNGGTAVEIVPAGTTNTSWTRYNADVTPDTADGDFVLQVNGAENDANNFFVDAVQLEEGTGAPTGYFSTHQSELIMRIGNDEEDKISFQSMAPDGGTIQELMAINNTTVRVFGDFVVDGTTTTINSAELTVDDNTIIFNSNMTGDPDVNMPDNHSELIVERGDEPNSALRWNEVENKWELTNDGTNYYTIMASADGDVTVNLDAAYNGGSAVTVDDTNVDWALAETKKFIISDAFTSNPSKFSVTSGSGLDSVKIDTAGGLDIDAAAGVTIDGDTVITGETQVVGAMDLDGAIDHDGDSFDSNVTGAFGVIAGGDFTVASVNAAVDASAGISLDAAAASNFTVDDAGLTLSTTTSGDVVVNSAGALDMDAASATLDAATIDTTGVLTQTGDTQIIGDLDLDGNFDQSGNHTFLVDSTATALDSVRVNTAGGMDIDAASTFAVDATDILTTGALVQTGTAQIIGDMDFDGSIDADGEDINLAASGTGGTHLKLSSADAASITSVGLTLEAGSGALTAEADAASSVNVTGASLTLGTTTSGAVRLASAGAVTFDDSFQTNPVSFSQASADGFAAEFAHTSQTDFNWTSRDIGTDDVTSIMAAVNSNRQDLWEYVELLSTQGSAVGVAAGANLIGVDGITGVVPMDGTFTPTGSVGDDATLQEILNGLATSSGGGKTYADEDAFLTDKGNGSYFKQYEHVRILDTNRTAIVLTQSTETVEGTDWDYLYGSARPIGDAEYVINATSAISMTTADFDVATATFDVAATGAVLVDGDSTVTLDATGDLVLTTAATADLNAVTFDVDGTTFDGDFTGAFAVDSAAGSHINVTGGTLTLGTTTSGDVSITSAGNIVETATTNEINVTSFDVNASGAFTIDGAAASLIRTNGANVQIQTISSGEIMFKDAGMPAAMPLSDSGNRTLDKDPDEDAIASIFDAINRAYNNTGDTSKKTYYEAPTLSSADVSAGYVQVSDESQSFDGLRSGNGSGDEVLDLPGGGSNLGLTASQLRNNHGIFLAIYLNGLRLSDSEWVYIYDQATGRKVISFVNDHSSHPEFDWSTVDATDAIALSVSDHIVFDCTYNRSSNV